VVDTSASTDRAAAAELALRILPPGDAASEADILAALHHHALPKILEIGTTGDGCRYILREWVDGTTPAHLPRDPRQLREWLRELLEGLSYLHQRGVLHLDLKPGNLVKRSGALTSTGASIAILDFGMAVRSGCHSKGGTPFFAAPEILMGAVPDARADLFAIGAMTAQALWEQGSWSLPRFARMFPASSFEEACGLSLDDLPPPFDAFVRRCVSRQPNRRFPDAQAALEFLCGQSGRPSRELLTPDPVAMFGSQLLAALPGSTSLTLVGGSSRDRRALAMHAACELGETYTIDEQPTETVLDCTAERAKADGVSIRWSIPEPDLKGLRTHLELTFGLAREAAHRSAEWLTARQRTEACRTEDVLNQLVAEGEIVARGSRWSWPRAQSGQLTKRSRTQPIPSAPDEIRALAAAGNGDQATAAWEAMVSSHDPREPDARTALARGLLDGGEPARALPLCTDAPVLRAQALLETGSPAAAAKALEAMDPTQDKRHAARIEAQIHAASGQYDAALRVLTASGCNSWQTRVTRAAILEQAGRTDECRQALHECQNLSEQEHPFAFATTHTVAGHLARRSGSYVAARQSFEAALRAFNQLGHLRHSATALLNLGVLAKDRGDGPRAVEFLRDARVLFERAGDVARASMASASLGITALEGGDARTAADLLAPAATTLRSLGDHSSADLALACAARAHAELGERERAQACLEGISDPTSERATREADLARNALQEPPVAGTASMPDTSPGPSPDNDMRPSRELFRAFVSVNQQIARATDLEQAMHHLLATAVMLTGARRGHLLVAREDGLQRELEFGETPGDHARSFSRSLAHKSIEQRRTMSATDALSDRDLGEAASVRGLAQRSALCVPFSTAHGIHGAVYVEHPGRIDAFGPSEAEQLEILSDQAAIAVDRMLREQQLTNELNRSRRELAIALGRRKTKPKLLGKSKAMQELRDEIRKVAGSEIAVLICGETGTGKELVARSLHAQSPRARGPFIAENCSAMPEALMERELFGHVRGAFTGADEDRPGLLEQANGGTLFLDEVGDMGAAMQAKLLRALQEQSIRRVGDSTTRDLDLRIVAATHKDLREMILAGTFRQDLFYRLAGVEVAVPPLRQRDGDALELAAAFVSSHAKELGRSIKLSAIAEQAIRDYDWPGNVRELEHIVARATLLTERDEITDLDLPDGPSRDSHQASSSPPPPLKEVERQALIQAMQYCRGDKAKAARVLGVSRTTLYNKLKRHDLYS